MAFFFGAMSFVISQASSFLIDINKLDSPKICKDVNNDFLNKKIVKTDIKKSDKINMDSLSDSIINEESYKMLNNYNNNLESIIRQKKIDEYYKKKEEIIRTLNDNKNKKIENPKVKVLQRL